MKTVCLNCHTNPRILKFYSEAESVVRSTNKLVKEAEEIVQGLREENLLTPEPFDEPIEFLNFDMWHYGGRTAKHGAFMGGADFVQWHGYYELVSKLAELKAAAEDLRQAKAAEAAPGSGSCARRTRRRSASRLIPRSAHRLRCHHELTRDHWRGRGVTPCLSIKLRDTSAGGPTRYSGSSSSCSVMSRSSPSTFYWRTRSARGGCTLEAAPFCRSLCSRHDGNGCRSYSRLSVRWCFWPACCWEEFAPWLPGSPQERQPTVSRRLARWLGLGVGWGSIILGVTGLILHLRSDFFADPTLKNLVYTAPFVAPLAYTGVGLVLILNRTVESQVPGLVALGGLAGDGRICWQLRTLSGRPCSERLLRTNRVDRSDRRSARGGLPDRRGHFTSGTTPARSDLDVDGCPGGRGPARALTCISSGNLDSPTVSLWERFVFGAPVFAPLLFADLAVLAVLGLWGMEQALQREEQAPVDEISALDAA